MTGATKQVITLPAPSPSTPSGYHIFPAHSEWVEVQSVWGHGLDSINRTQVALKRLSVIHGGGGDAYPIYCEAAVIPTPGAKTAWGQQNSVGVFNGQSSALGPGANLYGVGDVVLTDKGHAGVSMFGAAVILDRSGGDLSYNVPRVSYFAQSRGSQPIDAHFAAWGRSDVAFDAAQAVSPTGLALSDGQAIAFDAKKTTVSGKFSTRDFGTWVLHKVGNWMEWTARQVRIKAGENAEMVLMWFGASPTAFGYAGQVGNGTYIGAGSTGTDHTFMSLRTARDGVEQDRFVIDHRGRVRFMTIEEYPDNDAAVSADLAVGTVYMKPGGALAVRF